MTEGFELAILEVAVAKDSDGLGPEASGTN